MDQENPRLAEGLRGLKSHRPHPGGDLYYGRYNNVGILKLDAFPKIEWQPIPQRKSWLIQQLGYPPIQRAEEFLTLTPTQVRAFLLLGTFLHELGHHVDRMNTRSQWDAANGEPFAIEYELRRQQELWPAFIDEFGPPK